MDESHRTIADGPSRFTTGWNQHCCTGKRPLDTSCSRPDDADSGKTSGHPNRSVVLSAYTHGDVVLRHLSFPYAVSVDLERQTAWCSDRSVSRMLRSDRRTIVPSLTRFDLHLSPNASVRVQVQLEDDVTSKRTFGIWCREGSSRQVRKPLTHSLARNVFSQPGRNWTRHEFASLLDLSTGDLSRLLFSEGECMRDTVRSSRLCRFLMDLPNLRKVDNHLSEAYGFNYRHLLEEAVYDSFGVTLATLAALIR